ncbi:MAG: SCO family protein [Alphaproteobacteria bacterium]
MMKVGSIMLRLAATIALACAASACGQGGEKAPSTEAASSAVATPAGCLLGANASIGGPIDLLDQTGSAVTQDNFHEAPTLIYFGFTFCPDVCPLALQAEKAALAKLGQDGQVVQPVMITLDPERDTPDKLAQYVSSSAFPEGLLGLTGTVDQIAGAAKAFKVSYQKQTEADSSIGYSVAHTSFFYLMDENWRLAAMYPSSLSPNDQAACLQAGLKREESPT